jgi:hypothetical protein
MNRDRGENDLQPTMPGARVEPLAPARGSRTNQAQPTQQRAIPMGGGPRARQQPAAPARAAPQRVNNYQAQAKSKGPARAG